MILRPFALRPLLLDREVGTLLLGAEDDVAGTATAILPGQVEVAFTLDEPLRVAYVVAPPEAKAADVDATFEALFGPRWAVVGDGPIDIPPSLVSRWAALATATACSAMAGEHPLSTAQAWRAEAGRAAAELPEAVRPLGLDLTEAPPHRADRLERWQARASGILDVFSGVAALAPSYGPAAASDLWFPVSGRLGLGPHTVALATYDEGELLLDVEVPLPGDIDLKEAALFALAYLWGELHGVSRMGPGPDGRGRARVTLRPHDPDALWVIVTDLAFDPVPVGDPVLGRAEHLGKVAGRAERAGQDGTAAEIWQICSALYLRRGTMSRAARAAQLAIDALSRDGAEATAERVARRSRAAGLDVQFPRDDAPHTPAPYEAEARGLGT